MKKHIERFEFHYYHDDHQRTNELREKLNELIEAHNSSLSPKEEENEEVGRIECHCGNGVDCPFYPKGISPTPEEHYDTLCDEIGCKLCKQGKPIFPTPDIDVEALLEEYAQMRHTFIVNKWPNKSYRMQEIVATLKALTEKK